MDEPQHWPTERMVMEKPEFNVATVEDLEGLPDDDLLAVARLCVVDTYAPDECIPCAAGVMLEEKRANAVVEHLGHPPQPDDDAPHILDDLPTGPRATPEGTGLPDLHEEVTRGYTESVRDAPFPVESQPLVERFAEQVRTLSGMVSELLEGPPIPPRDVTMEELAVLVVGAEKWVKSVGDLELAPGPQAMKMEIQRVIAKVRS